MKNCKLPSCLTSSIAQPTNTSRSFRRRSRTSMERKRELSSASEKRLITLKTGCRRARRRRLGPLSKVPFQSNLSDHTRRLIPLELFMGESKNILKLIHKQRHSIEAKSKENQILYKDIMFKFDSMAHHFQSSKSVLIMI